MKFTYMGVPRKCMAKLFNSFVHATWDIYMYSASVSLTYIVIGLLINSLKLVSLWPLLIEDFAFNILILILHFFVCLRDATLT